METELSLKWFLEIPQAVYLRLEGLNYCEVHHSVVSSTDIYIYIYIYIFVCMCVCVCVCVCLCKKQNVKSLCNETLNFFLQKVLGLPYFGSCYNCKSSENLVAEILE